MSPIPKAQLFFSFSFSFLFFKWTWAQVQKPKRQPIFSLSALLSRSFIRDRDLERERERESRSEIGEEIQRRLCRGDRRSERRFDDFTKEIGEEIRWFCRGDPASMDEVYHHHASKQRSVTMATIREEIGDDFTGSFFSPISLPLTTSIFCISSTFLQRKLSSSCLFGRLNDFLENWLLQIYLFYTNTPQGAHKYQSCLVCHKERKNFF